MQNMARGRVRNPQTDALSSQISAQSPSRGGKAKRIMAMVVLLLSPFLAKMKFCRRTPKILAHAHVPSVFLV